MRIAVVGHGRSPEGKGWGLRIDACDVVVRMWDWDWQQPDDYGARYDHGVVSSTPPQLAAWRRFNRRTPARSWLGYVRSGNAMPPGFDLIDPAAWRSEAMEMGAVVSPSGFNLTRGCAAACWAAAQYGCSEVLLAGFDNMALGVCLSVDDAFGPEYQAHYDLAYPGWRRGYRMTAGARTCGSHDIGIERSLVERLAFRNGVMLTWL